MTPLYKVSMPARVDIPLRETLESGLITEGPRAAQFQQMLGDWLGNPRTAILNSGTSALMLALRLAGVERGDEVITSPMTCLATNEPILLAGAKPVWCDVDPETGNMDPDKIEELIGKRTKAILFVDWAGTPCRLDRITEIAKQCGVKTIEDAAHAFGAQFQGVKVGNHCDFTCFSFQAIKHFSTVDGGALACKTEEDFKRAIKLRWFGLNRNHNKDLVNWDNDVTEPGYKFHMNDVNATIGIHQFVDIDQRINRHKANGQKLQELLRESNVQTTRVDPDIDSAYWIFTILLCDTEERDRVSKQLAEAGIGNNITHTRNDVYELFHGFERDLPGLDNFTSRMLNIPCGWWVSDQDLEFIVATLKSIT